MLTENTRPPLSQNLLPILKELISDKPVGNRWFKVNLHVHGQGSSPTEIVEAARSASIDLIAITDHQTFNYCDPISDAAKTTGRLITVLPGMEITAHEGCHIIGVFPSSFTGEKRTLLLGWLGISGNGETNTASNQTINDIFDKINDLGGVVIIPHPFSQDIGLLARARKMNTKVDWLATGYIHLMQIPEEKVRHIGHDAAGNWINRFVLASATEDQINDSTYCLAPFNRSDAHEAKDIADGSSWFRMSELSVEGLKQVACEPKTRISREEPADSVHDCILGIRVLGGYCDGQLFKLNDGLNCIVGDNHSGKSSVLDFMRFALLDETLLADDDRQRLVNRMNGILGEGGSVEVYLRQNRNHFVVRRQFSPVRKSRGKDTYIDGCSDKAIAYFHHITDGLIQTPDFRFPLEVYEQGRVSRLREDIERQLDMLDEFAELTEHKRRRSNLIDSITASALKLKPLYETRELLNTRIASLSQLEQELADKDALLPITRKSRDGQMR
jgi:hypothetical protein